jgi:hypothetical protein
MHDKLLKSAGPWFGLASVKLTIVGATCCRKDGQLAGERIVTRIRSSGLLLGRRNRRFQACVACQPQRPQSGGLLTRGRTRCLVFGHCLLPLSQLLFLFLESRFGSVACLFSVGVQFSLLLFGIRSQDRLSCLRTGCRLSMWDAQSSQRRSRLFVPRVPREGAGIRLDAAAKTKQR